MKITKSKIWFELIKFLSDKGLCLFDVSIEEETSIKRLLDNSKQIANLFYLSDKNENRRT